ncbi:MAG TPA: MFS transporter [Streptosporangiaceae bacterium]|nr:MFS transporter [Streptosporangiaceae bacterium]
MAAAGVSQAGTQVRLVALPLVAVIVLHATTFQAGLTATADTAAFLLIGLPAGAWVDRLRRRPLLVAADLARAVLVCTVPVAAAIGLLGLPQLYAVAFAMGLATVLFDVAHMSYVPFLAGPDQLVAGNARLEAVDFTAFTAGPAAGGLLVQFVAAPAALVADGVSYLLSALLIGTIRAREPAPEVGAAERIHTAIRAGIALVVRHPKLRTVMITGAMLMLSETAWTAIQPVFLIRKLGLTPAVYGALLAAGAVGGLGGALSASRITNRFGTPRVMRLALATTTPFILVMPFARAGWPVALYAAGAFISWFGSALFNITQMSLRQQLCPPRLLGRMNATMRFAMWGSMPLGGLLGGALGQLLGVRTALWIFGALSVAATLPVLARSWRD